MRLYPGKVPFIARETITEPLQTGDIEVLTSERDEAVLDIEAILSEYLRVTRELNDRAKEILEIRNLDFSYLYRVRKGLFEEKGIPLDETIVDYLVDQTIEMFMHSVHIDEVYADDNILRGKIGIILRKHMEDSEKLDQEVRDRIKNLEEGTDSWEIEYKKMMSKVKRTKNLD